MSIIRGRWTGGKPDFRTSRLLGRRRILLPTMVIVNQSLRSKIWCHITDVFRRKHMLTRYEQTGFTALSLLLSTSNGILLPLQMLLSTNWLCEHAWVLFSRFRNSLLFRLVKFLVELRLLWDRRQSLELNSVRWNMPRCIRGSNLFIQDAYNLGAWGFSKT